MISSLGKWKTKEELEVLINKDPGMVDVTGERYVKGEHIGRFSGLVSGIKYGESVFDGKHRFYKKTNGKYGVE
jgi:hypothetical protein